MQLASAFKIKLQFPINKNRLLTFFGSVEVENVTFTPATGIYWDNFYDPTTTFLYILRDFYKFH